MKTLIFFEVLIRWLTCRGYHQETHSRDIMLNAWGYNLTAQMVVFACNRSPAKRAVENQERVVPPNVPQATLSMRVHSVSARIGVRKGCTSSPGFSWMLPKGALYSAGGMLKSLS